MIIQGKITNVFSKNSTSSPSHTWLEYGQLYADDSGWTSVSSTITTFIRPLVFLSLPNFGNAALSLRISDLKLDALSFTTFKVKVSVFIIPC